MESCFVKPILKKKAISKKVGRKTRQITAQKQKNLRKRGDLREALSYMEAGFEQEAWPGNKAEAFDSPEKSSTGRKKKDFAYLSLLAMNH